MNYKPLTNDKKTNIEMPDVAFQCSPNSQLVEINRTRRILLIVTGIEFIISALCMIVVIYAYTFGYTLGIESYNCIVRFLPFVSGICFLIGLIVADRYHVKGLRIFVKISMLHLIFIYLMVTIFIVIPICMKNYKIDRIWTIVLAMIYQITFCIVGLIPGYTIRLAEKLSKLLADDKCLTIK